MNLLDGAVCFTLRRDSWRSRAIAWVADSSFSHCFIGVGEQGGTPLLLEASTTGVELTPVKHYSDTAYGYIVFMPLGVGILERETAQKKVMRRLDEPYAWTDAALIGVQSLLRATGLPVTFAKSHNVVCVTLVLEYLLNLPAHISQPFKQFQGKLLHPNDLLNMIRSLANAGRFSLIEWKP